MALRIDAGRLFFMAYLLTVLITISVIAFLIARAEKWGLLDHPGDHRRHTEATPNIGGIAMFAGSVVGIAWYGHNWSLTVPLFVAGGFMLAIGIWDDRHKTTYFFRFVGQLIAAAIMIKVGGVVLDDLGYLVSERLLPLNRWSVALTLFGTVGVINALNMSDGMDGLAGGLTLVTLSSLIIVAAVAGSVEDASILMIIASTVVAFLLFNARIFGYQRARTFMGDAGSMWLGLTLSWFLISLSQGEARAMAPVTALWITAVPLIDAVGSLLRRATKGRSPFQADLAHYHHYLMALGCSVNQALIIAIGSALVFAAVGMLGWYAEVPEHVMFFSFLGAFAIYLVAMEFVDRKITARRRVPPE
jgi:UDP-GlcNAc:undecaprenyl-phosphate GlcNAc-1-phosphate transferase